jgi:4-amino-4-deoxy-L-arabinose transferase-like glycosyltransferase
VVSTDALAPAPAAVRRARPRPSAPPEPAYARPALLGILVLAAVLFTWNIRSSNYHPFYSETARSMSLSWKGFVFGSFDPGNTITIDKLPGFLWPQAISARLLGFHPWSLTLPQVVEGVLSVLVLHRTVRRWAGTDAALLAAGAFTLTPAIAGLFRTEVEDPLFTLLLLLAADATLRAAREARLRPLLAAGVWVGLSFQAKMLEAWAVLPALGVLYVVTAPTTLRRRLGQVAAAGAVCLVVSASWVLLATVTPAKDRPYMDGTTNNSAIGMVVGYNFMTRFGSLEASAEKFGSVSTSGMVGSMPARHPAGWDEGGAGLTGGAGTGTGTGTAGRAAGHRSSTSQWGKMLGKSLASQNGWLYPAAALSALCGLVRRRGKPRTDPLRAGFLLWTVWLATYFLVFSAGAVGGHTYYMGVVAVPMATLFGAGTVQFWRAWRTGGRWGRLGLPAVVASTVAWSAFNAERFPEFLPWLAPVALALGAGALALLASAWNGDRRRVAVLGLVVGVVAMLLPSAAWASSVLDPKYGGSGMGATGPVAIWHSTPQREAVQRGAAQRDAAQRDAALRRAVRVSSTPRYVLNQDQQRLLAYTRARQDGAEFLFATTSWRASSSYILYAGAKVLPMGGFTGVVPSPTLDGFRALVAAGRVRYVLLGGPASEPGREITPWVVAHCARTGYRPDRLYECLR